MTDTITDEMTLVSTMTETATMTETDVVTMTDISTMIVPTTYVSVYVSTDVIDNVRYICHNEPIPYLISFTDQDR